MGKNIDKNINKSLSGKHSQKRFYHPKKPATDALKTSSKKVIKKAAEAIGNLLGNKIATKITKVSEIWLQNNSETVTYENDKEIRKETPKERYISPEKRQKIIELR